MAFLSDDTYTNNSWWHQIGSTLDLISVNLEKPSAVLSPDDIEQRLDHIHYAYSMAHRVTMPVAIQAQLIATICNIQMSYCARKEGEKRDSAKLHRMAQVEWLLLQELFQKEGFVYHILH